MGHSLKFELARDELLKNLHLLLLLRVRVSQVLYLLQSLEHLALAVAYQLLLVEILSLEGAFTRAHHKVAICIAHASYVLVHALVDLVAQVSLQARVLLIKLDLEHVLDPLDLKPISIDLLSVEEVLLLPVEGRL